MHTFWRSGLFIQYGSTWYLTEIRTNRTASGLTTLAGLSTFQYYKTLRTSYIQPTSESPLPIQIYRHTASSSNTALNNLKLELIDKSSYCWLGIRTRILTGKETQTPPPFTSPDLNRAGNLPRRPATVIFSAPLPTSGKCSLPETCTTKPR